ncbi:hypothetical protein BS17DRAFT_821122 [Gyrodon lividus]|nr:hypothetical protein BS17DRAFT_821122 [Gyrodon lividus]
MSRPRRGTSVTEPCPLLCLRPHHLIVTSAFLSDKAYPQTVCKFQNVNSLSTRAYTNVVSYHSDRTPGSTIVDTAGETMSTLSVRRSGQKMLRSRAFRYVSALIAFYAQHHLLEINESVDSAKLCLVIATSSTVYPTARYARDVAEHGGPFAAFSIEDVSHIYKAYRQRIDESV